MKQNDNTYKKRGNLLSRLSIFDLDWWQEIWITIMHNKARSFFTAFGVFWGMLILVIMIGAGTALRNGINGEIAGMATNSVFFQDNRTTEPYKGFRKGRSWYITSEDIVILRHKITDIEYLAPILFGGQRDNNVVHGERTGTFNVMGHYPEYILIEKNKLIQGRYVNDIDIAEKRKVCVIGKRIYNELFAPGENALGKNIQVNGVYFSVIGVTESVSSSGFFGNVEELVTLPFTTLQQTFNQGNRVHFLAATAKPGMEVTDLQNKISAELKYQHNISPTDNGAVWSVNMEEQFNMFNYLLLGINILIWFVGMGTLVTGGIGISNIMLVTVRERTKEIGIRRALGATPRNIIVQIMSESVILTIIAGLGGLMLGVGILAIIDFFLQNSDMFLKNPEISFNISMAILIILVLIGTFAGYLPARRAMKIKPIEAIREE